jgi:hypothetical protein
MSHSRNDQHRNYKDYDDERGGYMKALEEKKRHRKEKKMSNALRSRNIDMFLYEDEDDY